MTKVLIVGGAQGIGFHISSYLAGKGYDVVILDNFDQCEEDHLLESLLTIRNISALDHDLCDKAFYQYLPEDIDYIYHFAGLDGTQNFYDRPFDVINQTTLPTIYLLQHYAENKNIKRFFYASSSETYASSVTMFNWEVPTGEDVPLSIADPTNVRWSYGGSKLHSELAVVSWAQQYGMPYTIARYHNVFGPRMGKKHVIPDFLQRIQQGIFELYGADNTRSFIYIDDAVRATVLVSESNKTKNQIFNIGSELEITMLQLGEKILSLIGKSEKITCYPSPDGSVPRRVPDLKKIFTATGFQQEVGFEEGLEKTINYYLRFQT
ncbi:MAG: NAD-dependent epimerase/dehydratase family protein [Gammaproteobacteria bacterium]|nr:NAD-dependent epimerase/dehydratase family protein [Gammaproteobacteria bacterium]